MNLIEKLLSVDKAKVTEKETKKIKSKKLAKLVGEDAEITIRELSGKRYNALKVTLTVRCPELSSAHQTIALCLMQ